MEIYKEPGREITVVESCDVLVCGAGPAGVAAALAAARTGARTVLIEMQGCLGGIWTAGALSWIMDCSNKAGILAEILHRLQLRKAGRCCRGGHFICDVEELKLLLEEMCLEAGVKIRLYTRVAGAAKDEKNRMTLALTESASGREAWRAAAFIDTTGNGDLAAYAGCGFDLGKEDTGEMQPMSLIVHLQGIQPEDVEEFNNCLERTKGSLTPKKRLLEEMKKAGITPSYEEPSLFHIRDDLFILMANHEYGVSALDASQLTQATVRARAENFRLVKALQSLGDPWEKVAIVGSGAHIGVREGRRIHGLYRVSQEDLREGRCHEDAVCQVRMGIDVHSTDPKKSKSYGSPDWRSKPYDIPLRALIARDVKGLLMAGRCISGDFIAHSSYRVTGDAAAMGQSAGITAALSAAGGVLPESVSWEEIKKVREIQEKECAKIIKNEVL